MGVETLSLLSLKASTGTIDIEYLDPTGMPCALVNGESHAGYTGKVTIDGCVFKNGARVIIKSRNVELVSKFTAEHGAKVEFAKYVED